MKYLITEQQYNKLIDKFITYYLEPHDEIKSKLKSFLWIKNDKVIACVETKYFYICDEIWDSISIMFSLGYAENQSVIKIWLEKHYNLGGLIPIELWKKELN